MKTKVHLLCNAHIDPVWLWRWNEGAAETVSTFRTAAEFCEKYDGFVFNHNESLLYEWIEEYEPELFKRIQKLVKNGKWNIMGGWFLQPDCQMISGESFILQIEAGRKYFNDKFSVQPTVAVNFDPFGHTRGLVQILKKTGYRGYVFMRDGSYHHSFRWKGFDNSEIIAHRIYAGYASLKGKAKEKVEKFIEDYACGGNKTDCGMVTWGIGDHGGGASVPDIEDISKLINTRDDVNIFHSGMEAFFDNILSDEKAVENLEQRDNSIEHCMVGCYTSMVRIKQLHRCLENRIYLCEKMAAHDFYSLGNEVGDGLEEAKRALMLSQFHDILPGSCIKAAEEDSIALLNHGIVLTDKLITKAFFDLCAGQPKPLKNEIPIMVYNPFPYKLKTDTEVEFCLESQNWNENEYTVATVYDEKKNILPTQNEEPASSLNLDWRKKVVFSSELEPFSMNRFNCRLFVSENRVKIQPYDESDDAIILNQPNGTVKIGKKTGLIAEYVFKGKKYLEKAGSISVIEDNEDPWGMTVDRFDKEICKMTLMSDYDANRFCGYSNENVPCVRVIENGAVRTVIQAFFEAERSIAVVNYIIPKNHDRIDISVRMFANDCNRFYKYNIRTLLSNPSFFGQTAFGTQRLDMQEKEVVFHQWCGIKSKNNRVYVFNRGRYGGSCDENTIKLSLLRTPIYAAHPIPDRKIAETNRFTPHIDMGERTFDVRIMCGIDDTEADAAALEFNQQPEVMAFFPDGNGVRPKPLADIDNKAVILTLLKRTDAGEFLVRLYNSTGVEQNSKGVLFKEEINLRFKPYEVRTFVYDGNLFRETDMLGQ